MDGANPIILYDGVCGLCNSLVQFLLKRDKQGRLRFASLQSDFAAKVLQRHGIVYTYEQLVDRTNCQTEELLATVDDPEDAYQLVKVRAG